MPTHKMVRRFDNTICQLYIVAMILTLRIPDELKSDFDRLAIEQAEEEICGVMVGSQIDSVGSVAEVRIVKNIAENKIAGFMMDPVEFLSAVEDTSLYADNTRYSYLGIIHSHPKDRPYPSITDWYGAAEKGLYHGPYVIYSVSEKRFNGFYWNGDEFLKMGLR
jgi:proteasome lid subunit RPN8/RPN11